MRADGSDEAELLLPRTKDQNQPSWHRNGKVLIFSEDNFKTATDILVWSEDGKVSIFLDTPFNEVAPCFSANGQWVAYASDKTGRYEIHVRPYPDGEDYPISSDGGSEPRWSSSGRELFYRNGDSMMAVPIEYEPIFKPGVPHPLFEDSYDSLSECPFHDVADDGQRFIMIGRISPSAEIRVVRNWIDDLKLFFQTGK